MKIDKFNKIKNDIFQDFKEIYGDELISMFFYNITEDPNIISEISLLDAALVLLDTGLDSISKSAALQKKWKKNKISIRYFFNQDFINNSLDVYPMEYLNMQQNNVLLGGVDLLKDIKISKSDLRLQCERELRGLILHMRSGYAISFKSRRMMNNLLSMCRNTFSIIFRSLLFLKDKSPGSDFFSLAEEMEKEFNLQGGIKKLYQKSSKLSLEELNKIYADFFNDINSLIKTVDTM